MVPPFYCVVITALSPAPDMLYDWAAEAAAHEAKRGIWL
jgi:hypothetical protein